MCSKYHLAACWIALSMIFIAPAAVAKPADARPHLPVTTFHLNNGLTVLVSEDHSVPLVAVDVWYHVGSKDERVGRTGFAHLFEHLMFQGSAHVGDDQHFRLIAEAGGWCNGTTSKDRTNFFEVVPSNFIERALFLEADRMGFLLETVSQAKLDNQRDVVRNERRQNYENRPYGMASKALDEALYPEGHPYRWLTIGEHRDLEQATLDDVKDFFRTWYTPANATLALVGDVTVAQARRLVNRYFGAIAGTPTPKPTEAKAVKFTAPKRLRLEDKVSLERLYLVWPSPAFFKPGDAELDLLAGILSSKSGRLYRRLVYELQVAQSIDVVQDSGQLGSEFTMVVTAKPKHTAHEIEQIVDQELAKLFSSQPITEAELERARNGWEAKFVYALESVGGFNGRAERLSSYVAAVGHADALDDDLDRYLKASVSSVSETARQVLTAPRVTLAIVPLKQGN